MSRFGLHGTHRMQKVNWELPTYKRFRPTGSVSVNCLCITYQHGFRVQFPPIDDQQ